MAEDRDRFPPLRRDELTAEQRRAADALVSGRRGALFGPFVPLLRSPELLNRAQRLGEYLRYECAVPVRLRELAILVTARHFRQAYEWSVHAPAATQAGVAAETLASIAAGHRPRSMQPDEAIVHDFCTELHGTHEVSDGAYAAAHALLGEQGVIDLCGLCGYYGLLALVMNTARTPLPDGATAPW